MNHVILILYILCFILGSANILISSLLHRKYGHRAFLFLAILIAGAMCSVMVEAVRDYNRITTTDFDTLQNAVYLLLEPAGEIISFIMLPMVTFATVNKKIPKTLNLFIKFYAVVIVSTFPFEVLSQNPELNLIRELTGHFFFHIFAYTIILMNYQRIINVRLQKALKRYLILSLIIIPSATIVQTGLLTGIIPMAMTSIPLPYIMYFLLFNLLCLINTFTYLFIPVLSTEKIIPRYFLQNHHITKREKQIIELLLKGYSNKQIGIQLFISSKTVKNHIYNIYKKTDAQNRMQLANEINQSQVVEDSWSVKE